LTFRSNRFLAYKLGFKFKFSLKPMSEVKLSPKDHISLSDSTREKDCEALGKACDGSLGDIVTVHARIICRYYDDVLAQAQESFKSAKLVATVGFAVLIFTGCYVLAIDINSRFSNTSKSEPPNTVANVGLISSALIEFIAGINFWLYARASKQFATFHICLERTNRYLIAYKISEKITDKNSQDETLEKLVCIMANASMITHGEIDLASGSPNSVKQ
jgi:hypothetical protein